MGNTATKATKTVKKTPVQSRTKARKATFIENAGKFTPVNKRAKAFATVLGVKELDKSNLKAIKKAGLRVYGYRDGALRAIRV